MKMEIIDVTDPTILGASEAKLTFVSTDVSVLSLSIGVDSIHDLCPFEYGRHYRIVRNGKTWLVGTCTDIEFSSDGANLYSVKISDYFWLLKNSTFIGAPPKVSEGTNYAVHSRSVTKIIIGVSAGIVRKTNIGQNLKHICETAKQNIIDFDYDISLSSSAELVPYATSMATYCSMIQGILKWRPNAVAWWDYSSFDKGVASPKPILRICDQSLMDPYVIDLMKDEVGVINLRSRPDLVPPAVGFVSVSQSTKGSSCYIVNQWPQGVSLKQPGCLVAEFSDDSTNMISAVTENGDDIPPEEEDETKKKKASKQVNLQKMRVKGKPMPSSATGGKDFWQRNHPRLKNIAGLLTYGASSITPAPVTEDPGEGYDEKAIGYELIEGMVSDKTPTLKWSEVVFMQYIKYPGTPPKEHADLFPRRLDNGDYCGQCYAQVRTINGIGGTYIIGGDYQFYPGDEEPPEDEEDSPQGGEEYSTDRYKLLPAARSYYESTRIVPYEGAVSDVNCFPFNILGRTINILNGKKEWETMTALSQSVEIDLFTDLGSIKMGPPSHLSLSDIIERMDSIAYSMEKTRSENTETKNPTAPTNENISWESNRDKKHPQAPAVGPMCKILDGPPVNVDSELDFQMRLLYNEKGDVIGSETKHGNVSCLTNGAKGTTGTGWAKTGKGAVYCNIYIDKSGKFLRAEIANKAINYRPYQEPMDGMNSESSNPSLEDYEKPGYYSYLIAEVVGDKAIQHHTGTIVYSFKKGGSPMGASSP